jgi:hypothetical protein
MPYVKINEDCEPVFPDWCLSCGSQLANTNIRVKRMDPLALKGLGLSGPVVQTVDFSLCAICERAFRARQRFNRIFIVGLIAFSFGVPALYDAWRGWHASDTSLQVMWVVSLVVGLVFTVPILRRLPDTVGIRLYAGDWNFSWKNESLALAFADLNGTTPTNEFEV